LIKSNAIAIELKKEDYFSEAGKIAQQVAFVDNGILRVSYYNNKGKEITRYFIEENNFAVDLNSFSYQIPSSEYLQAITDCKLFVFSADALKDFQLQSLVGMA
jgi:CRP-like cAMP-binding protein